MHDDTIVLLAAQDAVSVRILQAVFRSAGHGLLVASSEEVALTQAREQEVDLAIVEWDPDNQDSLGLVRRLHDARPGIGVALLVESGQRRSGLASLASGVHRYLLKPLNDVDCVKRTLADIMVAIDEAADEDEAGPEDRNKGSEPSSSADGSPANGDGADESQEGPASANESDMGPVVRVLVADTDGEDAAKFIEVLTGAGCVVKSASCAQEALLELNEATYDVLIVGYDMGDMTADDVLLRAKRVDPELVVIVTAPESNLGMTTALLRRGAMGFLEKPLVKPCVTAAAIVRYGQQVQEARASAPVPSASAPPEQSDVPDLSGPAN